MRFCQLHWDNLRDAIRARGLWPLVAQNGADAIEREVQVIEGTATDATYDPLMACHWMISGRALEALGLYLMTGNYCPVCEVMRAHPKPCPQGCTDSDVERAWINGPANAALEHVKAAPVLAQLLAGATP